MKIAATCWWWYQVFVSQFLLAQGKYLGVLKTIIILNLIKDIINNHSDDDLGGNPQVTMDQESPDEGDMVLVHKPVSSEEEEEEEEEEEVRVM